MSDVSPLWRSLTYNGLIWIGATLCSGRNLSHQQELVTQAGGIKSSKLYTGVGGKHGINKKSSSVQDKTPDSMVG